MSSWVVASVILSLSEPGERWIRLEIRKHCRGGLSPERVLTEEPRDANMAKLALSQLPLMVIWVSLGIVLGLLQAVR